MPNRLAQEKSPYLLQHKDNPVDWWPWGEEAFAAAAEQEKPVFLSIGYATCHWCHVMERESFEDAAVARLMNDAFINIKVDREERPDIDAVYMTVCQMMTGSGGWPLTIIMTPQQQPFFAATYIPRVSIYSRIGMLDLVPGVAQAWKDRRDDLTRDADRVSRELARVAAVDFRGAAPAEDLLHSAYQALQADFDMTHGGFGGAPKFPAPSSLRFLLRYWKRTGIDAALQMVGHTLVAMRCGGIYDHVGWGFHRYATDAAWKVPHFEKMLYDQATLAITYTEAFQATREPLFAQTAHEILRYVLRDMTRAAGGFYSGEDADSEGEEGKFYMWTRDELQAVLGEARFQEIEPVFNIREGGNFQEEATRQYTGRNILYRTGMEASVEDARKQLFELRKQRIHPLKDDKILTDWNGLMIAAMALAARVFNTPEYADAAVRAATFVAEHLQLEGGRLCHRWREGEAIVPALLDDYVFMAWGMLELYETTFDEQYLERAQQYCAICQEHFRSDNGAYYLTPDDGEPLLARTRPSFDAPIPSGNAVMTMNLLRLGHLTSDMALIQEAWEVAKAHAILLNTAPASVMAMFSALDYALGPVSEVVIAGRPNASDTEAMLQALRSTFLPNTVTLLRDPSSAYTGRVGSAEMSYAMVGDQATAYVCENFSCQMPTTEVSIMLSQLEAEDSTQNDQIGA